MLILLILKVSILRIVSLLLEDTFRSRINIKYFIYEIIRIQ